MLFSFYTNWPCVCFPQGVGSPPVSRDKQHRDASFSTRETKCAPAPQALHTLSPPSVCQRRVPGQLSELLPLRRLLQNGSGGWWHPRPRRFPQLRSPSAQWLQHVSEQYWLCRFQHEPRASRRYRVPVLIRPRRKHLLPGGQLRPQPEPHSLCLHRNIKAHWSGRFTHNVASIQLLYVFHSTCKTNYPPLPVRITATSVLYVRDETIHTPVRLCCT